jgi:hypothetical protein
MPKAKNETVETENETVSADETKDTGFYNPHDGLKGRDGGPYLDYVEREQAEKIRANKEDREPVFDGSTPAVAGTPLVPASQVIDNSHTSNPSRAGAPGLESALDDTVFDETDFLADPVTVLPVSTGTEAPSEDERTKDGGKSASPGAEVQRGEGPDESENPEGVSSAGSEPANK